MVVKIMLVRSGVGRMVVMMMVMMVVAVMAVMVIMMMMVVVLLLLTMIRVVIMVARTASKIKQNKTPSTIHNANNFLKSTSRSLILQPRWR